MHANKKNWRACSLKSSTSSILGHVPHFQNLLFCPTLYKAATITQTPKKYRKRKNNRAKSKNIEVMLQ